MNMQVFWCLGNLKHSLMSTVPNPNTSHQEVPDTQTET